MPRFNVLLKIRKRVGGAVRADELWVEAEGETGLQAMESARLAYLPMGDPRVSPPVSVHGCVPFPAEAVQPSVSSAPREMPIPAQARASVSQPVDVVSRDASPLPGEAHAPEIRQVTQGHQPEHPDGDRPRKAAKAGGGDSAGRGPAKRKGWPKGKPRKAVVLSGAAVLPPEMQERVNRMIEAATNDAAQARWIRQQAELTGNAPSVVARKWPAEKRRLIQTIPQMLPRDDPPTPTPTVIPPQPVRGRMAGEAPEPPGLREAVQAVIEADL